MVLPIAPNSPHSNGRGGGGATPSRPFTKSAIQVCEETATLTGTLGGGRLRLTTPTGSFLRHLNLRTAVDVAAADAVPELDAPHNTWQLIRVRDNAGGTFYELSGYSAYLADMFGGYGNPSFMSDFDPAFAVGAGGGTHVTRLPVEIVARSAFGALPNFNDKAPITVELIPNDFATVYGVGTPPGDITAVAVAHGWAPPDTASAAGVPQETSPPHTVTGGVVQQWSELTYAVPAGAGRVRCERTGNVIRNMILVARDPATGARSDAFWPDRMVLSKGRNDIISAPIDEWFSMHTQYFPDFGRPDGVIALPFTDDFDGTPGGELGDRYLETTTATRLEFSGSWAGAHDLTVITNDLVISRATSGPGSTMGADG
jgi:hypothetical protein